MQTWLERWHDCLMTDPIPDHTNRVAYILGRVFHPAIICIPTLALILSDLPLLDAILWTVLVAGIVTVPGLITIALLKRQDRYVYQRQTRCPVYIVAWLSVVTCSVVIWLLDGPVTLRICVATLAVWLPVQLLINTYYTKISTHVAVAVGCATGLWMLEKLNTLFLQVTVLVIVLLTIWARVTTRNHTVQQVILGLMVGAGSVLVVFPLLQGAISS